MSVGAATFGVSLFRKNDRTLIRTLLSVKRNQLRDIGDNGQIRHSSHQPFHCCSIAAEETAASERANDSVRPQ